MKRSKGRHGQTGRQAGRQAGRHTQTHTRAIKQTRCVNNDSLEEKFGPDDAVNDVGWRVADGACGVLLGRRLWLALVALC